MWSLTDKKSRHATTSHQRELNAYFGTSAVKSKYAIQKTQKVVSVMSSSSMSESCQSGGTQYQISVPAFEAKIMAITDQTEELEKEIDQMRTLQEKIYEFRGSHVDRFERTKERIIELHSQMVSNGKNMVNLCNDTYKKLLEGAEPYLNSGYTPKDPEQLTTLQKCFQLRATIKGLEETMKRTQEIGPIAMGDHKMLSSLEAKQREAMRRREKLFNVKRLANEFPDGAQLHFLAVLPALLMILERSENVSAYYQENFKKIESKIFELFESLTHNEPSNFNGIGSLLSTQSSSSLSNGEINLNSIKDHSEIPLDISSAASN
ncbi:hypothetical protein L5515_014441 [Caenorhabditis briggsae]|uniref:Uncharacterized protein n=4 Tax=Caenorhabditis briggsae TaxID=6238 RepID=A0AAE9ED88_CAEBR|nr:hypothetical protein L3Y34_018315 [Caenorhabditis briggsae]UMM18324.1 hypothetical protein L5515_014441 [Caenorhabditis briggsae]